MDSIARCVRDAVRAARRDAGATAVAALSLGIAVGLVSSVFAIVEAALLRQPPYPASERLLRAFEYKQSSEQDAGMVSAHSYAMWRGAPSAEQIAAYSGTAVTVGGGEYPERAVAMRVTPNLLTLVGAAPAVGRLFDQSDVQHSLADDQQTAPPAVVISHGLWLRQFGGRPDVVASSISVNGLPARVVGVMSPAFRFVDVPGWGKADCWMLQSVPESQLTPRLLNVLIRVRPAATIAQLHNELQAIGLSIAERSPRSHAGWRPEVRFLRDVEVAGIRLPLLLAATAAGIVVVVAASNVGAVLLAAALGRLTEYVLKMSMGATRRSILQDVGAYAAIIGLIAGAIGALISVWLLPTALRASPRELFGPAFEISFTATTLFAVASAILIALVSSTPSIMAVNRSLGSQMFVSARVSRAARGRSTRRALVAIELGLAVVLCVNTALLFRSARALEATDIGFDPEGVLAATVTPSRSRFSGEGGVRFESQLLERLRQDPRIQAAAFGFIPLGGTGARQTVGVPGSGHQISAAIDPVSPDYFFVLRVALLSGRLFTRADEESGTRVAVVNRSLALDVWGTIDVLGNSLILARSPVTIVGVIGDIKRANLQDAPGPAIYVPSRQARGVASTGVLIRSSADERHVVSALRRAVAEVDPGQPVSNIMLLANEVQELLAPRHFALLIVAVLAVTAACLSVAGVYGVTSETVRMETREIGVRLALGATRAQIVGAVVTQSAMLACFGAAIGVAAAFGSSTLLRSFMFGVSEVDPLAYGGAVAVTLSVAIGATLVPAIRASKVDPASLLHMP